MPASVRFPLINAAGVVDGCRLVEHSKATLAPFKVACRSECRFWIVSGPLRIR